MFEVSSVMVADLRIQYEDRIFDEKFFGSDFDEYPVEGSLDLGEMVPGGCGG